MYLYNATFKDEIYTTNVLFPQSFTLNSELIQKENMVLFLSNKLGEKFEKMYNLDSCNIIHDIYATWPTGCQVYLCTLVQCIHILYLLCILNILECV